MEMCQPAGEYVCVFDKLKMCEYTIHDILQCRKLEKLDMSTVS